MQLTDGPTETYNAFTHTHLRTRMRIFSTFLLERKILITAKMFQYALDPFQYTNMDII